MEVGTDEIKYRIFNDHSGPMYSLDKDRIIKVVYETEGLKPLRII